MKKLLIGLAISLAVISPFKSAKAEQPHINISCENYGLKSVYKFLTQDYVYYYCWDTSVQNHNGQTYYYLGGMRKNNSDNFILLPISGWGDGYFHAENGEYSYTHMPPCSPSNMLNTCYPSQPATFYIKKGTKTLDKQIVYSEINY